MIYDTKAWLQRGTCIILIINQQLCTRGLDVLIYTTEKNRFTKKDDATYSFKNPKKKLYENLCHQINQLEIPLIEDIHSIKSETFDIVIDSVFGYVYKS